MSDKDEYRETWFIVPSSILDLPNLKLCHLKVFETIFQFWNKSRKCFLSNPEISRRTGVAITQVKEAIAYFEGHKELERVQIGMKRYLRQPHKAVEIPSSEIDQKELAPNDSTCTKDTHVARNRAGGGPKSGQGVARNRATEIKNLNKEFKKDKTPISPSGKKDSFGLSQMLEENPFNIPEQMISDWLEVRKTKRAKMTATAWKGTNSVLQKLRQHGLNPVDCFESMVASGWQGIKFSYFEKEIAATKHTPVIKPVEDRQIREQLKQQAIEREQKEEAAKQREREQTKGGIKKLIQGVDINSLRAKQEAERIKLGMSTTEYHDYIIRGKNE